MELNACEYTVLCLLGKGKGGYSYLVCTPGKPEERFVLKQIHHEPCSYYQFGDKLQSELRDYEKLCRIGIPMPRLLAVDTARERILKEYVDGPTIAQLAAQNRLEQTYFDQIQAMCAKLYPANTNIDYYPTNFVVQAGKLYYIDYECNDYMQQWDFEHWGMTYWKNQEAAI